MPEQQVHFERKPNPAMGEAKAWKERIAESVPLDVLSVPKSDGYAIDRLHHFREQVGKNRMLISQLVEESGFDREQSDLCVAQLESDLKFYSEHLWQQVIGLECTDNEIFRVTTADLLLAGRILGPLLRFGASLYLEPYGPEETKLVWYYLVSLVEGSSKKAEQANTESERSMPVVILDSADLCSAVDSVIRSASMHRAEIYWAPTHVFVQEPVYESVVRLLKFEATKFAETSGFKRIDSKPIIGLPEIVQPSDRENFRFFLGWDPRILGEDSLGVTVLPFRTVPEAVALANALPGCCCASVWSEKSKAAEIVASQLKMNTVWVNCHGVLEPGSSFAPDSERVPLNGPELFEHLLADWAFSVDPILTGSNNCSKPEILKWKEAVAAAKSRPPLTAEQQITLLGPICKHIQETDQSFTGQWHSNEDYRVAGGMEIKTKLLANSTIAVDDRTDDDVDHIQLVYYLVSRGFGVILTCSDSYKLLEFVKVWKLQELLNKGYIVLSSLPSDEGYKRGPALRSVPGTRILQVFKGLNKVLPFLGHLLSSAKTVYVH